jgi:hypothetical protein
MSPYESLSTRMAAAMLVAAAFLSPVVLPHVATAQTHPGLSNVVPESEAVTIQAKITAIDPATRAVTLVGAAGNPVTVTAGPVVRLDMLKVGDTVNVKYYRSVGFFVDRPRGGNGVPVSNDQMAQVIAQPAKVPGGFAVRLTQVSGTVVGINRAANSVDVVNPSGGGVYTIDVTNPTRIAMLHSLKVGDTVTAAVSETLAVSIEPAPKKWFQ